MDQRLIFKTREFLILLDGEKLSQKALKVKRELEKMIPNDDYEAMDLCGEKLIKEPDDFVGEPNLKQAMAMSFKSGQVEIKTRFKWKAFYCILTPKSLLFYKDYKDENMATIKICVDKLEISSIKERKLTFVDCHSKKETIARVSSYEEALAWQSQINKLCPTNNYDTITLIPADKKVPTSYKTSKKAGTSDSRKGATMISRRKSSRHEKVSSDKESDSSGDDDDDDDDDDGDDTSRNVSDGESDSGSENVDREEEDDADIDGSEGNISDDEVDGDDGRYVFDSDYKEFESGESDPESENEDDSNRSEYDDDDDDDDDDDKREIDMPDEVYSSETIEILGPPIPATHSKTKDFPKPPPKVRTFAEPRIVPKPKTGPAKKSPPPPPNGSRFPKPPLKPLGPRPTIQKKLPVQAVGKTNVPPPPVLKPSVSTGALKKIPPSPDKSGGETKPNLQSGGSNPFVGVKLRPVGKSNQPKGADATNPKPAVLPKPMDFSSELTDILKKKRIQ